MPYRFITQTQIDDLPDDAAEAFLAYEDTALANFHSYEDRFNRDEVPYELKIAFAGCIFGAAETYEVEGAERLDPSQTRDRNGDFDFNDFTFALNGVVTRLQIKVARSNGSGTVLTTRTRSSIETLVQELRDRIAAASELEQSKKKALNIRLDDLLAELSHKKFNFLKAMAIITAICTTVNQAEGALIRLPDSVTALSKVIGQLEGFEQRFFPKPANKIEHKQAQPNKSLPDLDDDDIPF